jgi:hypothetical protein
MSKPYKSYNLKLSENAYFKLRQIELDFEKKYNKRLTKSEVLEKMIDLIEVKK